MTRWRWSVLVVLLCSLPSLAEACQLFREIVQDNRGNVIAGVNVTLNKAGTTTLATLYSSNSCTATTTNPTTTASDGAFHVYVEDGYYDVVPQKAGYVFASVSGVQLFDPLGENVLTIAAVTTTDLTAIGTGAFDVIGANVRTLVLNKPTLATLDDTCPSTLTLLFLGDGSLTVSSGKTLTLNCQVLNLTGKSWSTILAGAGTYVKTGAALGQKLGPVTFSQLGTADDGTILYCSDCTLNSGPCSGSSTGARATRINGAWRCD